MFRVHEMQLFAGVVDVCSDRLGSAGLGSALPPKVGVSRRRDGNLSKKVASRVDGTTLDLGSVRFT